DAKAVGSCRCYLEVLEQDARAGDGGCCCLPTWEQDAKMVGSNRSGLGSLALMLRLLPRWVCRGRGCRRGGLGVAATIEEN
ncbi:hypothetical protein GW17_00060082, partial [Ensete ventricosum]